MRAGTPSIKAASRAVRSLKKKIARIVELKGLRDSGKDLSADQVRFVGVVTPSSGTPYFFVVVVCAALNRLTYPPP